MRRLSQLLNFQSANGELTSGGFRAILELCRLDLDSVRKDVACDGDRRLDHVSPARQGELEQRLYRVVERLEHAASTLDEVLDHATGQLSATAAAEVLAHEADHRIKNSLQTVISLLEHQAKQAEAEAVRDSLRLASARVGAVAQVHATLHATPVSYGIIPELELGSYLGGLCATLGRVMGVDGEWRCLHVEVEPLTVPPAMAQQLGLVVTELATNALRHAFLPDQPGTVRVKGARQRDGTYRLCVADDGKGLPRGFNCQVRSSGLGLQLVNVLANQLRARLTVNGRAGAQFTLSLPAS